MNLSVRNVFKRILRKIQSLVTIQLRLRIIDLKLPGIIYRIISPQTLYTRWAGGMEKLWTSFNGHENRVVANLPDRENGPRRDVNAEAARRRMEQITA
jgi:hypothetical protein